MPDAAAAAMIDAPVGVAQKQKDMDEDEIWKMRCENDSPRTGQHEPSECLNYLCAP